MRSTIILRFLILLFVVTGCSKDEFQGEKVSYTLLHEDHLSYYTQEKLPSQELVVKQEQEWLNIIESIAVFDSSRAEKLEELNINFQEASLIIIMEEFQNDCCNIIEISGIYQKEDNLIVDYGIKGHPGIGFAALSQAIKILKIPKNDSPVLFE